LMNRYPRHQTLGIERQYKKDVDFQIQRIKAQNARREDTASKIAARATEQPTDVAHAIHLEDTFLESVTDIDEIMERGPSEHDHNRALQRTMEFQESLERSHNNATARFHRTLELITDYSEGLSKRVREGREQIVDADYRLLEGPTEAIEPSGNPPPANSKCSNECQNLQETVAPPLSPQAEQREEAAAAPDESSAIRSDRATE
jgi:hypothetical protein